MQRCCIRSATSTTKWIWIQYCVSVSRNSNQLFRDSKIFRESIIKRIFLICIMAFGTDLTPCAVFYLREERIRVRPTMVDMRDIQFIRQRHHLPIDHSAADDKSFFVF